MIAYLRRENTIVGVTDGVYILCMTRPRYLALQYEGFNTLSCPLRAYYLFMIIMLKPAVASNVENTYAHSFQQSTYQSWSVVVGWKCQKGEVQNKTRVNTHASLELYIASKRRFRSLLCFAYNFPSHLVQYVFHHSITSCYIYFF